MNRCLSILAGAAVSECILKEGLKWWIALDFLWLSYLLLLIIRKHSFSATHCAHDMLSFYLHNFWVDGSLLLPVLVNCISVHLMEDILPPFLNEKKMCWMCFFHQTLLAKSSLNPPAFSFTVEDAQKHVKTISWDEFLLTDEQCGGKDAFM